MKRHVRLYNCYDRFGSLLPEMPLPEHLSDTATLSGDSFMNRMSQRLIPAVTLLLLGICLIGCDELFPSGEAIGEDVVYYVETTNVGVTSVEIWYVDAGGQTPTTQYLGLGTAWYGDCVRKKGKLVSLRAHFQDSSRADTIKVVIMINDEIFASDMCWTPGCEASVSGTVP